MSAAIPCPKPGALQFGFATLFCASFVAAWLPSNYISAADLFQPKSQSEFVSADAKLEMLWAEGEFTEGPALAPDGSIIFSDIGNTIYRFDPKTKKVGVFRKISGRANGLMYDQQGRLIAAEGANTGGARRISITDRQGHVIMLADRYEGKLFNSPNDLAIDSRGNVYFSDPRYVGDEPRELDIEVVFLVSPKGAVRIATRDVTKPNGIALSNDGRRAYVSDNDGDPAGKRQLVVFDIAADGLLTGKRVLFDFGAGRGVDGMTTDTEGNIYATAGRGDLAAVYVFGPGGEQRAVIKTPGDPTNCVFGGGAEQQTLYITAAAPADGPHKGKYALYRIGLKKKGQHVVMLD